MHNTWNVFRVFTDFGNNVDRNDCNEEFKQEWARNQSQIANGPLEDYVGGDLSVFNFYDSRVFQDKLRGVNPKATPSACSEKAFMLGLQYTNNRMMNWVACRSLPIDERYAGPQYFRHRLQKDRLDFIPSSFTSTSAPCVRPRTTSPGWLCCDVCEKWRRVDADSLRI